MMLCQCDIMGRIALPVSVNVICRSDPNLKTNCSHSSSARHIIVCSAGVGRRKLAVKLTPAVQCGAHCSSTNRTFLQALGNVWPPAKAVKLGGGVNRFRLKGRERKVWSMIPHKHMLLLKQIKQGTNLLGCYKNCSYFQ